MRGAGSQPATNFAIHSHVKRSFYAADAGGARGRSVRTPRAPGYCGHGIVGEVPCNDLPQPALSMLPQISQMSGVGASGWTGVRRLIRRMRSWTMSRSTSCSRVRADRDRRGCDLRRSGDSGQGQAEARAAAPQGPHLERIEQVIEVVREIS